MRNNLLVGLVLAAASSSVFAMPSDPVNHGGILEIALTGGGFTVGTEDTGYGMQTTTVNVPIGNILKNSPEYKFGGSVLAGYYFPNSTINVDASYFGTRNRLNDSASGLIGTELLLPDLAATAGVATSSNHFDYDFANIEIGSLTRVNCNGLIINPQVGLSYAQLKNHQNVTYAGEDVTTVLGAGGEYDVKKHTKFSGFGPSIGFDLNYVVCNPISLIGSFRYNGLVGEVHSSYTATPSTTGVEIIDVSFNSQNSLVSLIQTEIALGYDFNWCDMFCGNFAIGYQLTKAIGSGEKTLLTDDVQFTTFSSTVTDSNIHGYFFRLTMDFSM